ncbi:MAG: DNA polymerase III subunit beta [Candidatus Berkelbacteria bacterium]|nr:DNA polymerase III subunit beta [Candidatus Berkelbacteria bacterium]
MKLSCVQEKLNKGLTLSGRLVGLKATLPVLNNVLLEAKQGKLIITSTDLEIAIKAIIGAKVINEGRITVPSRLLCDFIAGNHDKKIKIILKDSVLAVKSKHSIAHIRGIDASEFPLIPKIKEEPKINIKSSDLLNALNKVIIAAATDDTRPVLCGVCFKKKGDELKLVATDSYRLAEKKIKDEALEKIEDFAFIVPLKTAQEVARILSILEPMTVAIRFNENQIAFNMVGVEIISRLIEGEFPEYEQIIPKEHETKAVLKSKDFVSTIKTVNLFAEDSANSVQLNFDKAGLIKVEATSNQLGDNKSTINGEVVGKDNKIAFNAKFIIDALNVLGGEESVDFEMTGHLNPGIIKPAKDRDYLYVIMPLKTDGD